MDVRRVPGMWAPVVKRVPFRRWPAQPGQGGEGRVAVAALLAMTALLAVAWPAAAQTAPAAPTLTAAAGNTQVMLAWTQGDDGGSPLTGHEYRQSTDNGDRWTIWSAIPLSAVNQTNATSYTVTGLSNGTSYTFQVRAGNAEGDGAESNQVTATPATTPAAPTALTATAGHTQVMLAWTQGDDGGSPITGHEYRQGGTGATWTAIPNSAAEGANGASYTVTGLSNGTSYTFQVRAGNVEGDGAESNQVTATPAATAPAAPTEVTATPGNAEVTLKWISDDDGGSSITGHEYIQVASEGGVGDWTAIPNSAAGGANATSYTVTGLSNGKTYAFSVRAGNAVGTSAQSSPPATATPAATAPAAPTALTATAGHAQVMLAWTHGEDGGSVLTGHEYRQAASGEEFSDWTAIPNSAATGANATSYTVTGLSNGTSYTFQMRAGNAEGTSAASPAASATPAITAPAAPTALTATAGHAQVRLAWTHGEDGGSPITGHEYRQITDNGGTGATWTAIPNSAAEGANGTSYTVTGLSNGVEYTFQVRAGNAVGLGAPSPQAPATPSPATAPAAPTALTATAGHAQVRLAWPHGEDGGSPLTGHEYRQSTDDGDMWTTWNEIPLSAVNQANATSYTVTGLSNGTSYTFQVRAGNAEGDGAASPAASATPAITAPAAPTALTAGGRDKEVRLAWTSGGDGGSPLTGHEYRQSTDDGDMWTTWSAIPLSAVNQANGTSYTVTGLSNGTSYTFQVRAGNAVGLGVPSPQASATPAPATVPARPTNLKATAGHTQVTLKWTNGDDGGSAITRHRYWQNSLRLGEPRRWTNIPDSGPDGAHFSSYTVTGLRNGEKYGFRVRALNAVGESPATTRATTTPMTADPPAAPTALTASAGDTRVTLAWTQGDNGGSPLNRHEYRQSTDTGTMWAAWTAIPNSAGNEAHATRYTVSGLTNGTSYTFQVRAVNAVGPGGPSGNADATPATSPPPPTLTATAGDTQVWLTWTSRGDGGRPLTGYEYRQQAGSEVFGAWAPIPASAPTGAHFTSYTVTGLTNGTTYTFQVRAGNAVGDGAAASPASATPMLTATVPPAPPTLTATAGNAQVWLTWASGGDGGRPLTGHEYRVSTVAGTWAAWTPIPASGADGAHRTSYTVTRLTNGTTYTFQVRAGNAVGPGAASPVASATPVTVPAVPRSLTASAGDTEVTLKWIQGDDGGRPLTGYEYRQQAGSGAVSMWTAIPASAPAGQNGTGYTVTGLTNGTRYTFHVRAVSAEGRSPASPPASATPATVPAAPTTLTATAGNTRVTLAWTNGGDGGRPLTGHQYRESIDRGLWGAWTAIPLSAADEVHATRYTVTGLTNGTGYLFEVRAVNAVGPGASSDETGARPTPTVTIPRGPPNLTATTGNAQVTLAWTRVDDGGSPLTRHEYQQSTDGGSMWTEWSAIPLSAAGEAHTTSYTVTGLSNGTTYSFVVRAVNAVGESTVSNRATATPTTARAPLAPPALTATAGDTRVTLAWTQGDDGGSPITGHEYRQQAGSGAFGAWTAIPDSAATGAHGASYTVSGLTNGIRYSFYVRAVNIVGPGGPSAGTRATPVAVPPPPSLTATAGNTQVWLAWTSRGDGGSPLTGHEYRQQAGSGVFDAWLPIPDSAPTGAHGGSYIVTGLTNGTSYTFQVRAGNAEGDGAASSPARATPTVATTVPAAPPSLTATPGNAQVWLTWTRGSDGGSPLTGHQYRQRTDSGSTWTEWTAIPDSAPAGAHGKSYTVTGLTNGTSSTFEVRAGNAEGDGAASPVASATPGTVPAAPTSLTATPGNAEVRLAWTRGGDGGSPLTGHQYRQRTDSGSTWTQWSAIPDSAPAGAHGASYTVTGLSNGTTYTFEVRAGNTAGASLASPAASATPRTVPAAPTSLTATPGNAQVTLAWSSGGDGGSPLTGHEYRQRTDNGDTWTEWSAIPDSAPAGTHVARYTVTRLTNGTTYTFEVRAGNTVGEGPASNAASATLGTVPSAPRDLTATPGNAQVTLAWTRGDDGGIPLTGHEYRQAAGGVVVRNWTAIPDSAPAGAHGASYTVTGLSNGTTYSFYVRAVNTAGAGPASNAVRGTPGAPEAPKTLTAAASSAQVTLTWSRGGDGGSPLIRHEYRQSTDDGSMWGGWTRIPDSAADGAHVTSYTVTRLTNGTPYTFEVRAVNAVGASAVSNAVPATPAAPPAAPTTLTATPGDARVTLAWTRGGDGGSPLTGHEYRQSSGGVVVKDWTPIPDSAPGGAHVTSYTVTRLTNGTTYTFEVRAVNTVGEGPASNAASATPGAPAAPRDLTAAPGDAQVRLAWARSDPGSRPLTGHEYRQSTDDGGTWADWTPIPNSAQSEPNAGSYTVTRLTNGTTYTFEVRAGNAVGRSAISNTASATPGAPGAPPTLTATPADAQVTLAWSRGDPGSRPLTRHEYRQSLDDGGTWADDWTAIPDSAPGGAHYRRYTVTGLSNGTTYTFEVRAVNGVGLGAASNAASATPGAPAAPRDLTAAPGDARVTLAWSRGDGGSPLTGHEYRQSSRGVVVKNWTAIPDSAMAGAHGASYTVTGLSNGTTYWFAVRAVNAVGASAVSNAVPATPAAPPAAPTTLTATPGDARVTLAWTRGGDGGSPLTGHEYRQSSGGVVVKDWTPIPDSAPGGAHVTSYTVTRLTNGTTYTFEVRAGNAVGDGAASNAASATPGAPAAPRDLTAAPGDAQVRLAWARSDPGSRPLTGHEYRQSTDDGGTWADWTPIPNSAQSEPNAGSYTVTRLTNGTTYTFEVRAGNTVGEGPASNTASATPGAPGAPQALGTRAGDTEVRLAWRSGGSGQSPIVEYEYRQQVGSGAGGDWTAIPDSAPGGTHFMSYTVTGLSNGTTYTFEVRAVNGEGEGAASASVSATPATVPFAPRNLTATSGNARVTLAWSSGGDGGRPVTRHEYRQQAGSAPVGDWTLILDSAGAGAHGTSYTVTGLTNGTTYTFEVRALNGVGEGPASNAARATPQPGVPHRPTNLRAKSDDAEVTLAWNRGGDGGRPFIRHEYRQSLDDGGMWERWTRIPDSAADGAHFTSYTVTGLTNGTTYTFQVRAVNGRGESPASNAARATPGTGPSAPGALTATPGNAQVTLVWTRSAPGLRPFLRHEYRQQAGSGTVSDWTPIPDSAATEPNAGSYTVTGLTNGTTYTFEVRAVSAVGEGPASNAARATPGVPGAPGALTATPGNAQVTLAWNRGGDGGRPFLRHEYRQSTDDGGMWERWTRIPDSAADGAHFTSYTVTGLTNGTTYTFEVRAVNGVGEGPASNAARATPGVPGVPGALTATPGNAQVTLVWTRSAPGLRPFLRHEYRQQAGSGTVSDWTPIPDSAATEPNAGSYTVTGLSNGTTYTFEVRAVSAVGEGPASNTARATPQLVTVPPPPTNLTAEADDAQVTLAWTRGGDGGRPLTEHQYRQSLDDGGTWAAWTPIPTSAPGEAYVTRYTVRGLSNGTIYTFQVRAVNELGVGAVSNTAQARPTGEPTIVALALTSDPDAADGSPDDDTYIRGATVEVTVTFSEAVTVRGRPQLTLDLGGTRAPAAYVRGTGTPHVVFAYTIKAGDVDSDGLAIPADALTLPAGATLQNLAGTRDARVTHPAVPAQAGHRVDGVPPTLAAAELDLTQTPPVLVLTFSKPLAPYAVPVPEDFTIAVERPGDYTVTDVALDGATVTLTLTRAGAENTRATGTLMLAWAGAENTRATVTYSPGRSPLQDMQGNAVAAFQNESLTVLVDVTLSELTLPGVPLTPAFAPDRLSYTATVAPHVAALTLTATPTDPAATVALTPADADTATPAHDVALLFGRTTLQVTVTGVDTLTRQTYTVTVTRRVVSAPGLTAWLARFGRTVATQVTDAVGTRLRAAPGQGSQVTVGGYRLPLGERGAGAAPGSSRWGADSAGAAGRGPDPRRGQPRQVTLRDLLVGSTFQLTLGRDAAASTGPRVTAWGRIGTLQFNGHADTLAVDGDVLTGTLGVDGAWDRWLAGVAVSHSRGDGALTQAGAQAYDGALEQTLTSLQPYLRYAVTDRLMVWGLVGYGWGELTVAPAPGVRATTDTALLLGAVGSRGILLAAPEHEGFELATRTDVMLMRMTADAAAAGLLPAEDAAVHRLRLVLEGSRAVTWAEGRTLRPAAEIGLRHDWGDAETGLGVEVGGQVQYADPGYGLTVDAGARVLLAHAASAYQEWGAWGTVRLAPGGQGLALTLTPAWGATTSGVEGLWARPTPAGLAPAGPRRAPGGRLHAEVGYAFAPGNLGVVTPYAGTVLATGPARTWRLGTRWQVGGRRLSGLDIILEGQRQNAAGPQPVNQGLHCQVAWGF